MPGKPTHLAIDFGTSNSLVAAASADRVWDPIPLDPVAADPTIFRTLLYFPSGEKVFYGAEAVEKFRANQADGRLIRSIKRQLPNRSFIGTYIDNRPMNLEDLVGLFLKEVRRRAAQHFGEEINQVVLGRPARFSLDDVDDGFAQHRLEESAKRAGFTSITFCPEPLAAAYEFRSQVEGTQNLLVGDFGGGTSDFTVIRIGKKHFEPQDVLSLGGIPTAGDALDGSTMRKYVSPYFGADVQYKVPFGRNVMRMPAHLMAKICSPADISFLQLQDATEFLRTVKKWALSEDDRRKMDRLLILVQDKVGFEIFEKIERAKRDLSEANSTTVQFPYPGLEFEMELTRGQFDEATSPQVKAILAKLDDTVTASGLKPSDIDVVCCTGGTAKVRSIHSGLVARFGETKLQKHAFFHSVVKGLAHRAQEIARGNP